MAVKSDDLIHADQHGAVVVPSDKVEEMMKAMEKLTAQEAKIIEAARSPEMTLEKLKAAIRG
jgi:regulator of RNase E activity RraA